MVAIAHIDERSNRMVYLRDDSTELTLWSTIDPERALRFRDEECARTWGYWLPKATHERLVSRARQIVPVTDGRCMEVDVTPEWIYESVSYAEIERVLAWDRAMRAAR